MTRTTEILMGWTILVLSGVSGAVAQESGTDPKSYSGADLGARPHVRLSGSALTDVMIQNAISIDGPVTLTVPRFKRMGDGLAVAITRLTPDLKALSEGRQIAIGDIVRMSFANPRAIMKPADRSPTASLALLDLLDVPGSSVRLHKRIASAKLAIQTSLATLQ